MSAIVGEKIAPEYLLKNSDRKKFSNIGAIKINGETKKRVFEIFNLLTARWVHTLNDSDLLETVAFFSKHYDLAFIEYFKDTVIYQKNGFDRFISQIKELEDETKHLNNSTSRKAPKLLRFVKKKVLQITRYARKIAAKIKNLRK